MQTMHSIVRKRLHLKGEDALVANNPFEPPDLNTGPASAPNREFLMIDVSKGYEASLDQCTASDLAWSDPCAGTLGAEAPVPQAGRDEEVGEPWGGHASKAEGPVS